MKSNLLLEMQHILGGKAAMSMDFPMPCYLFVQKYGRNIEHELDEIAKVMGREKHFFFKAEGAEKEETVFRRFLLEQDRHAELGKMYNGCILIELSGEEPEKEMFRLLDYLDKQQHRMSFLFTTKNYQNAGDIKKQLEQFFFVRVIDGEKYKKQEQQILFESTLKNYQFELTEEAKGEIEFFFKEKEWKETDMVEKRIRNLVSDIVYSKMLESTETNEYVGKEDINRALRQADENAERRNTIGFVIG